MITLGKIGGTYIVQGNQGANSDAIKAVGTQGGDGATMQVVGVAGVDGTSFTVINGTDGTVPLPFQMIQSLNNGATGFTPRLDQISDNVSAATIVANFATYVAANPGQIIVNVFVVAATVGVTPKFSLFALIAI